MAGKMLGKRLELLVVFSTVLLSATHIAAHEDPVCYGYLGCFPMGFPWNYFLRPVPAPQPPDLTDVQFNLYTKNNPQGFTVTKLPEVSLQGSDYDGKKPTYFVSHGYQDSLNSSWINAMKDALIVRTESNIIVVNWKKGAAQVNYLQAASNTRTVGAEVARLMKALVASYNASTVRFHLIGHSLGAHVMSYAAKSVTNIARITALDPAQPAFEGYGPQVGLDKTDANFVQVIHTNARPFFPFLGVGMMAPVGHVDFYMNGGWDQPGCNAPPTPPNITSIYDLSNATYEEITYVAYCPHSRAVLYLTAFLNHKDCLVWGHKVNPFVIGLSILTGGNFAQYFKERDCNKDTCSPVGIEAINYPARGTFFVATTAIDPFCISEPKSDINMAQYRSLKDISGI